MKTALYIDSDASYLMDLDQIAESVGFKIKHVSSIEQAKPIIQNSCISLVICEVDLPDGDGISFFNELRRSKAQKNILHILFSAKNDIYIQVLGLESGADDFWIKPLNKRLLQAKLKALLKRADRSIDKPDENKLRIDRDRFIILLKGKEVLLPRKEFEILNYLFSQYGKVINREEIKNQIWTKSNKTVNARTVDVHIKNIRERIGEQYIKTVKGVGYKFSE